jgi:hypothetical protein
MMEDSARMCNGGGNIRVFRTTDSAPRKHLCRSVLHRGGQH